MITQYENMFFQEHTILFKDISNHKSNLLTLSQIDKTAIQRLWIRSDEKALTRFDNMVYDFMLPLFAKMIFRFQEMRSATYFWCELDPSNRYLLLTKYGIPHVLLCLV